MRVYLSADIEGCTGLVSWSQCSRPDGSSYDYGFARRMMTHDVNAAVAGALRAGATQVMVKDSHGNSKNLLNEDLLAPARLVSGYGGEAEGMVAGVGDGYDACVLVGYHARAGTAGGVMEHTITGSLHRMWVNGQEAGEIALAAWAAGAAGVPLVAVSSDAAGAREAEGLVPGLATAVTKTGRARYMADLLRPDETDGLIAAAVEQGLRNPPAPVRIEGEATVRMEFNRTEQADLCALMPGLRRVDGYTVEGRWPDYPEAHRAVWTLIALSTQGLEAQR